ncbi:MAG: hypothetical protein WED83_01780 [Acidimicrobiia bacterium]
MTPTYALFPEIAQGGTETTLSPEKDFRLDLSQLEIGPGTTLVVMVNPNNPNGAGFDVELLPEFELSLLRTEFYPAGDRRIRALIRGAAWRRKSGACGLPC